MFGDVGRIEKPQMIIQFTMDFNLMADEVAMLKESGEEGNGRMVCAEISLPGKWKAGRYLLKVTWMKSSNRCCGFQAETSGTPKIKDEDFSSGGNFPDGTLILMFLGQRRLNRISVGPRRWIFLFPLLAMPFTNGVERKKSTEGTLQQRPCHKGHANAVATEPSVA